MRFVTLAILAATGVISVSAPALAQPFDHPRGWHDRGRDEGSRSWDLSRRVDWLQRRIEHGRDDGTLDRREAFRVQSRLDEITRDMRMMQRENGGNLSHRQRDSLEERLDRVNSQIRWLRQNDDARPW